MKKMIVFLLWMSLNIGLIFSQNIDYQVLKTLSQRQSPADNRFNKFVSDATLPPQYRHAFGVVGLFADVSECPLPQ